jgi:hypothetical protein
VDLDYNDSIHLSIATNVVVNFPQPRFAVLPVNLGVEVLGFGGTVRHLLRDVDCHNEYMTDWRLPSVVIAYHAIATCFVDATARGEQAAFALVASS